MTTTETATVAVLTAEVRVLQVGRRQITMSVFRQLDRIDPEDIEPFGGVSDGDHYTEVAVVGRDGDGQLVASAIGKRVGDFRHDVVGGDSSSGIKAMSRSKIALRASGPSCR